MRPLACGVTLLVIVVAAAAVSLEHRSAQAPCCTTVIRTCCTVTVQSNDTEAIAIINAAARAVDEQRAPVNRASREDEARERENTRDVFADEDALRSDFMKQEFHDSQKLHDKYVALRTKDIAEEDKRDALRQKQQQVIYAHEKLVRNVAKTEQQKDVAEANKTVAVATTHKNTMKQLLGQLKTAELKVRGALNASISVAKEERKRTLRHRNRLNKALKKHLRHMDKKNRYFHADLLHKMKKRYTARKAKKDKSEFHKKQKLHAKAKKSAQRKLRHKDARTKLDEKRMSFDRSVLHEAAAKRSEAGRKRRRALKWIIELRTKKFESDRAFEEALVRENDEKRKRRVAWQRKVSKEATLKAVQAEDALRKFQAQRAGEELKKRSSALKWEAISRKERMKKREEHWEAQRKFKEAWAKENKKKKELKAPDLTGAVKAAEARLRKKQDAEQEKKTAESAAWRKKADNEHARKQAHIKLAEDKLVALMKAEAGEKATAKAAWDAAQKRAERQTAAIQKEVDQQINLIDRITSSAAHAEASSMKNLATQTEENLKIMQASPLGSADHVEDLANEDVL